MDNSTVKETWIDKLVDELVDTKEEITGLTVDSAQLDALINIILNNSRLDYAGKSLTIDSERVILEYIKAIFPLRYAERLKALKAEAAKELSEVAATEEV